MESAAMVFMTASCVAEMNQGHIKDLRKKQNQVLSLATIVMKQCSRSKVVEAQESALHDFISCNSLD